MASVKSAQLFAQRLQNVEESSTMQVMIAAQKLKSEGVEVVDLGAGEPDFNTPENIKEAAKRAIDANFTRYTPAVGVAQLRDAILRRYREDFGVDRKRDEVMATVGGKHSIFNTLLALINPGDDVIIPAPYWVTFPQVVHLCGGRPVIVETSPEQGFSITSEIIHKHITDRTKLVILNSPCNPTGAVIEAGEFLKICQLAAEREIYVLSDECYQVFLYDGLQPSTAAAVPEHLRRWVIVSGSLSKTYAMTGWRLGYTIGPSELVAQMAKIQGHETSNPTSIAQAAGIEALTGPQDSVHAMIREYQRRRDFLVPALNQIPGVHCFKPQGAFYVYPDIRAFLHNGLKTSDDFAGRLLSEAHVAVTPGSGFGMDGFIRISYAAAYTALEEAVRRLANFLRSLESRR
jgi:aspartate aminotransferase